MFTKKPSREWLRVASLLVVLLLELMLPAGDTLTGALAPSVNADITPQAVPFRAGSNEWTGIDDISVFVPSDAKVDSFTAKQYAGGKVLVEWHTGLEVNNLGFNVYREVNGKRVLVTPQILAGSALTAGERTNLKSGYSYAWADSPNARDAQYWLEAINLNGESTLFGPVSAGRAETPDGLPPERGRALLLSGVGNSTAPSNLTAPLARAAGAPQITAAQLAAQSGIAAREAIKLSIKREGWYRVTQTELIAAGLDQSLDPRMLQLYVDGQELPFVIKGEEDGHFDPLDAVEFYGIGLDTAATDTRVYWLAAGSEPGRRIQQVKGKGARAAPASSPYTVERKDRTIYFSGLRNGDQENFFGAVIVRNPVDQMITVRHLDKVAAGDATVEVALQGVTAAPHRVSVELNGNAVGELSFAGQAEGVATFSLSQAVLKEGQNVVRLTPLGTESDVSLVDYIRITYPHTFTADDNALRFNLSSKRQVTIDGFSGPAIRVLDITDPNEIRQVSARVQQQGEGYSVTVSAPKSGERTLWALADGQAAQVAGITSNRPSNLRDAERAADFVIISHRDFLESVKPLQSLRESQGLSVSVVDVEDVYDEFGYGDKSPQAIKDFLAFARTNWRTPPRFALFVGDASLDPRNYMGRGDYDFVPARLIDTLLMETVSDEWLADFDGDGLAEMALGRLPVRTGVEASRIIDKIVNYESAPRTRDILLVSDLNDGIDFQSERDEVRTLVPADVNVSLIDRGALGTTAAKSRLIESLNRGPGIVSYFGHGNIDQWRGDLLTSGDAAALANGEMRPVVLAITCLNGYFQDPVLESLAESLIKAERGGAVAVWASSGMCDSGPQALLDQEMFRAIFAGGGSSAGALTLGEAVMRAKSSIGDRDVRLTYILFGDPTSRIK
jgi:Peptidase family C25